MNDGHQHDDEHVQCKVCLKEIPLSEAKSAEATEYVAHYCGLDCYEKWMEKAAEDQESK